MKRFLGYGLLLPLVFVAPATGTDRGGKDPVKEALQALNDYIGEWKGSGAPVKPRPQASEIWSETVSWGWRFKGDDSWLTLTIKNGKYFKAGELRYLPDTKRYQLTLTDKADKKQVFEGELKNDYLRVERKDPDKNEVQRVSMNLAGDGARFIYLMERRPATGTIYSKVYQVACTKEGESLGAKQKKIECVVSGGLGTMPVSYNGETFYVCCSGCRDAFNENPKKYVDEFKAKKAKK